MESSEQESGGLNERAAAAARLEAAIADRSAVCVVIGLGHVGTTTLEAILDAGFEAHGYDRDPVAVARFQARPNSKTRERPGSASTDETVLARADIVLVAVRALVRQDWSVNLEPLKSVAKALRNHPRGDRLVLIQSTLPPRITRAFAEEWLGADETTFVAHTPERLQAGDSQWTFKNTPHLTGGVDEPSGALARGFFATFCDEVVQCRSSEVSEVSKLMENAFLAVGISFIGEMSRMSHALGISAQDVAAAAATKPFGYLAFYPGSGIGGHCIPNDLQILRRAIRDLGMDAPLLDGTTAAAADMPRVVVDHLADLLQEYKGQSLEGQRVLLVGVGFKVGSADTTDTPARDLVRYLRQIGAIPVYVDSAVPGFIVDGERVERVGASALTPGAFAVGVVHSGDRKIDGAALEAAVSVLLDAGGGRIHPGGLPGAHRL